MNVIASFCCIVLGQAGIDPEHGYLLDWDPTTPTPAAVAVMEADCEAALRRADAYDARTRADLLYRHAALVVASDLSTISDRAKAAIAAALAVAPNNPELHRLSIVSLMASGVSDDEVSARISAFMEQCPESWQPHYLLAQRAGRQRRWGSAISHSTRGLSTDDKSVLLLGLRAEIYCITGQLELAERDIERAMMLPPLIEHQQAALHTVHAELFMQQGRFRDAIAEYHRVMPYNNSSRIFFTALFECYEREELYPASYMAVQRAIQHFPDVSSYVAWKAALECQLELSDRVDGSLREALDKGPNDASSLNFIARCYMSMGRFSEANEAFERARQLSVPIFDSDHALRQALLFASCPIDDVRDGPRAAELCRLIALQDIIDLEESRGLITACAFAEVRLFDRAVAKVEETEQRSDISEKTRASAAALKKLFQAREPYRMPVEASQRILDVPPARKIVVPRKLK